MIINNVALDIMGEGSNRVSARHMSLNDFKKSNRNIKTPYEPYEDKLGINIYNEIPFTDDMSIDYDKILHLHTLNTFEDIKVNFGNIDFKLLYI